MCKHFKALALGNVLVTLYFGVALLQRAANYGEFKAWHAIKQILTLRKTASSNNIKPSSNICTLARCCYTLVCRLCRRMSIKRNKKYHQSVMEGGERTKERNEVGEERRCTSLCPAVCALHMLCLIAVISESLSSGEPSSSLYHSYP